jgi:hypothetical protein
MADNSGLIDLSGFRRLPVALVMALLLQTGAGLIWAGAAAERISVVEQKLDRANAIAERLARLEAEVEAARASLARLEQALDQRRERDR